MLLALNGAWVQWAHGATLEARGGRLYADERGGGGGGGGEGGAPRLAKAHGCMSCTGDEE